MDFVKLATSVLAASGAPAQAGRQQHKWPISYRSVGTIAVASDALTILICGVGSGVLYHFEAFGITDVVPQYLAAAAVVGAFYISVMKGYNLYSPTELLSLGNQISSVTSTWLGVFLFLAGAVFALKIGDHFSRVAIIGFATSGLVLLNLERIFYRSLLRRGLSGRKFSGRNAVLITEGARDADSGLVPTLLKHGFQLDHKFVLPADQDAATHQDEAITDIVNYLRGSEVEEILVSVDVKHWFALKKLISAVRILPLPVNFVPSGLSSEILRRPSHVMGDTVCIELQRKPLDAFELGLKRTIDVVSAVVGLVLLLPLLIMTTVMIKLDSPGPVLFRQKRCGFNGRPFHIYKFRTMTVLEDGPVINQAAESDCRVTRLGKWLRRTSIDELPQLLNVLNGSMSLVGPRPHAVAHDNHFEKIVSKYAFRQHVKPGLTGLAQVNGYRGPTPTVAEIRKRVECDLWYIDNWSLRLDFSIMIRTVFELMRPRNAY
jgi:putative colanic acid biosynthesis UDP-glucose lipid carrier transferase